MSTVTPIGSTRYDVIVVGARAAGASTAMLMARRGLRVLLLDRRRPGTDTLSTHAQMRGATLQLLRWGLLDRIRRTDAPPIRQTTFHYGDAVEVVDLKPSAGVEALYAPRRTVLDTMLVDAAREAGVDVRFGVTVQDLLRNDDGRVIGVLARSRSGVPLRIVAPITVGADGVRSVVARHAGATVQRRGTNAGAIIYSHWSGPIADGYEWFYRPGVSAGLIPTNHGETCIWVGAPSDRFMHELRWDPEAAFHNVLNEVSPEAAARLASLGRRQSRFSGFPGMPGFLRRPFGDPGRLDAVELCVLDERRFAAARRMDRVHFLAHDLRRIQVRGLPGRKCGEDRLELFAGHGCAPLGDDCADEIADEMRIRGQDTRIWAALGRSDSTDCRATRERWDLPRTRQ